MKHKYLRNQEKKKLSIPGWLFVAAMVLYNEVMLHIWVTETFLFGRVVSMVLFALAFGGVLAALTSLLPEKAEKWAAVAVSALLVVIWLTEYFLSDAYRVFMTPQTIFAGAGGVAQDYFDLVMSLLWRNLWRIGLMLLPIVLYACFCQSPKTNWKRSAVIAAASVVLCLLGVGSAKWLTNDFSCFTNAYNFDRAVRTFGLNVGLVLDVTKGGEKGNQELTIVEAPTLPVVETEPDPDQIPEETEPEIFYGYHEMAVDFEELEANAKNQKLKNLYSYINSMPKGEKNKYTGMFAGKNMIMITAEAFAAEVIDPELTPTLYRLANEGIKVHEYYQPAWGASTTTGEFSNLIGLVPANGGASMKEVITQRMFLTIGNQLQAQEGYTSLAYHNHFHDFYERHRTHRWLGYDKFIARGTGLDVKAVWPESDLEMMEKTVDDYINNTPFNIYYMTVSGHCLYTYDQNAQVRKHIDKVQHLNHSDTVKGYFACNLELEYALEYLVKRLEEAGIADDTVICIATDHYPYGLERSSTWENTVDHLAELYGVESYDKFMRDHNALIIWSGAFEDMDIEVTTPVYSLDILPTLSNLFDVPYDSRLLVGRDILSDEQPLVLWPDYSWLTDLGRYDASTGVFTPNEGAVIPEGYQEYIDALVANKITFSRSVQSENYYKYILDELEKVTESSEK